uniref:Uncharacterized protein n=1 Tax=Trichobilharzia regenti TaxID=157069 RepID=A0AA85JD06_TRIRE|nr:unnamed protein product [Trichobilharzia regenti]
MQNTLTTGTATTTRTRTTIVYLSTERTEENQLILRKPLPIQTRRWLDFNVGLFPLRVFSHVNHHNLI